MSPLQVQCETLSRQLQDTQAKLLAEKEETRNAKKRVELFDTTMEQMRQQLEKVSELFDAEKRKSSKFEVSPNKVLSLVQIYFLSVFF